MAVLSSIINHHHQSFADPSPNSEFFFYEETVFPTSASWETQPFLATSSSASVSSSSILEAQQPKLRVPRCATFYANFHPRSTAVCLKRWNALHLRRSLWKIEVTWAHDIPTVAGETECTPFDRCDAFMHLSAEQADAVEGIGASNVNTAGTDRNR